MKLIMYSHIGERCMRYTKRPFSNLAYSVSTFSTTCLPNEHTLVEHVIVMFSLLSYLQQTKHPIITFILWIGVKQINTKWKFWTGKKYLHYLGSKCAQQTLNTLNFNSGCTFHTGQATSTMISSHT